MSADDEDLMLFGEDDAEEAPASTATPWRVLVVDDEPDVHAATRFTLNNFVHRDRPVALTSAYSGKEALAALEDSGDDIDLILLDVVMETPTDGLDTARAIRVELRRIGVPFILVRSGQPAHLTDKQLNLEKTIDGYVGKSGLTGVHLKDLVASALDNVSQRRTDAHPG